MSYRTQLLTRWSRRDILSVVVIAVAVGFLTGTTVLVVAAGGQTTEIAGEFDATAAITTHESLTAVERAADSTSVVIPFAVAATENESTVFVLGRPPGGGGEILTGQSSDAVTSGMVQTPTATTLRGDAGSATVTVQPRTQPTPVPPNWYIAPPETVQDLGVTGAFVVHEVPDGAIPMHGVPLQAALVFFVLGTREALTTLAVVAGGSALLVGVVVFSVTRMTVRDRQRTIRIARATGATPRSIMALFTARAGLLTGTGVVLGFAVGTIAVNGAVNLAVFAGVPTSLSVTMTPALASRLVAGGLIVMGIGAVSGTVAALPAVRADPASLQTEGGDSNSIASWLSLSILDARALVPTAATLISFVAFVVLIAGVAGVVAPLSAGGATVTEPGATHPVASTVPTSYADALQARDIDASAEILLFEAQNGQPFTARGANYTDFASVTDASIIAGKAPTESHEAVIGADLARTLGLTTGDWVTLGGSTQPGVARVRIVGVFSAPGPYDDQLIVPLGVAQHLAGKSSGTAQFIRADRLPDAVDFRSDGPISDVRVPDVVSPNESFTVEVTVQNPRQSAMTERVTVRVGDTRTNKLVTVPAESSQSVSIPMQAPSEGTYQVQVGNVSTSLTVAPPDALRIVDVPAAGPPDATVLIRVRTVEGSPVQNATVEYQNQTVRTDADGTARIQLAEAGEHTISVQKGSRTVQQTIEVRASAERNLLMDVSIDPRRPSLLTSPTVSIELVNPWETSISRSLRIEGPAMSESVQVSMAPGARRTVQVQLPQQPPGSYEVIVRSDTRTTRMSYQVVGDERIAAAIASGGAGGSSGIGRAIETAFGNLRIVIGVVLGLAAVMTIGGTTAAFAQAVHAKRREIGVFRATGASPARIARLVLGDAIRLGLVATVVGLLGGLALLQVFASAGYLTVFGVRLNPVPSLEVLVGTVLGALVVTLIGAGLAMWSLLQTPPYRLLGPREHSEQRDAWRSRE